MSIEREKKKEVMYKTHTLCIYICMYVRQDFLALSHR